MPETVDFSLYLITDRHQLAPGHTLASAVSAALEGGVRAVQLREKDLTAAELLPLARELRTLCRQYNARLLINDRIDVARAVAADGVHLGGHSLPPAVVRELVGPEMLIGVSTHSLEEVAEATRQGADFLTFGPIYATPSKTAYGAPLGIAALAAACRQTTLPVFALGGIAAGNAAQTIAAGAHGVALISAIFAAASPAEAARVFTA